MSDTTDTDDSTDTDQPTVRSTFSGDPTAELRARVGPPLDTDGGGLLLATLGFDGLVYAASRYAPEYLGIVGANPVIIGLFGTLAMLLVPVAAGYRRPDDDRVAQVATPLLGAIGLFLWLLAPTLGATTPMPAWCWITAGLLPLGLSALGQTDTAVAPRPDAFAVGPGSDDWHTTLAGISGIALVVGLLQAMATLGAALQVLLAVGVVAGVAVALLRGLRGDTPAELASDVPAGDVSLPRIRPFVRALRSAPPPVRGLLLGETLVHAAFSLVAVFVVLVVTSVLGLQTTILGVSLGPSATFGALVALELLAAGVATALAQRRTGTTDRAVMLFAAGVVVAAFPLLFVGLPPLPAVVAALFAGFGLRAAGAIARRDLLAGGLSVLDVDPADYRQSRTLVVAVTPFVGGLLYTVSPVVAFGVASAVGAVGVRELSRLGHDRSVTA